jgi:hypothetical protein
MSIGVYAATIMFIKVSLATYHQLKWIFFEKCCRKLKYESVRIEYLKKFWQESYKEYKTAIKEKAEYQP